MGVRAVSNFSGKRSCHRMPSSGQSAVTDAQIAAIFAATPGAKVWYDPSDITTLQQDSTGIIPVTSAGQEIGRIMDKSGASNHATQAVVTTLPIWQTTYASFDGVDDSWATPSIDFTATNKVTVIVGVRKLSDAAAAILLELSSNFNSGSAFAMVTPAAPAAPNFQFGSRGTGTVGVTVTGFAAPISAVLSGVADISAPFLSLSANRGAAVTSVAGQGVGNYGNYPLYIGRRGGTTLPFNGNIYGLMIFGRLLTAPELALCESYMAQKMGLSL